MVQRVQERGYNRDMKRNWKSYSFSITVPIEQLNEPMLKTINWRYKDAKGKPHKIKITYAIESMFDLLLAKNCEMLDCIENFINRLI